MHLFRLLLALLASLAVATAAPSSAVASSSTAPQPAAQPAAPELRVDFAPGSGVEQDHKADWTRKIRGHYLILGNPPNHIITSARVVKKYQDGLYINYKTGRTIESEHYIPDGWDPNDAVKPVIYTALLSQGERVDRAWMALHIMKLELQQDPQQPNRFAQVKSVRIDQDQSTYHLTFHDHGRPLLGTKIGTLHWPHPPNVAG